jgi:hypothetical protein
VPHPLRRSAARQKPVPLAEVGLALTSRSYDPKVIVGEVQQCLLDDRNIGGGGRRSPKKKLQVFYNYATISLHFYDLALLVTYLVVGR